MKCDGRDNTKKLGSFISIVVPLKTVVGYIDIKQQETYEKLKNRGWYSKWYWYFINATTTDNNNNNDNTPASTVTATATTNNSNNYNNNVIIIKIIITIKMKSSCALKKIIKSSYIYCSPHSLFGEKNAP